MRKSLGMLCSTALLTISLLSLPCAASAEEAADPTKTPTAAPAMPALPNVAPPASVILPTKIVKLGYVDVAKVAEESNTGKAGLALFREKADKYEAQAKAKEKQLDKLKAALEAKLPTLPPEQRTAKVKEFDKKVDEFRRFAQNVEKEMRSMQEELNKNIFAAIEKAARTHGAANGFAVIITKKELLYLGPTVDAQDLTAIILKKVNEQP